MQKIVFVSLLQLNRIIVTLNLFQGLNQPEMLKQVQHDFKK